MMKAPRRPSGQGRMTGQSDSYFADLCENLGFILITVDRALNVRSWNRQAAQQFGRQLEEMLGHCILDIIQSDRREEARRVFEATIETRAAAEMEVKYDREEGGQVTFVLIASPILDAHGECIGASASMRDISERKRMSKELAKSRRMAALGNMAAGIAHHFNNIMGGMLTSIDYVLPSDSPRELRRTLRLLSQAIGRATRITKQLEAFAECEHEVAVRDDLSALMETFIDRIKPQAEQAGIRLVTEIADVPCRPEAQRLLPVLQSVAQNSFDVMSSDGVLTIRLVPDEPRREAVITIADTGCGIPGDVLDRVFEPFFTTKGELHGGTGGNIGLGLAAVHGLVAELGGTINLSSRVGHGTTVEIRMPMDSAGEDEAGP